MERNNSNQMLSQEGNGELDPYLKHNNIQSSIEIEDQGIDQMRKRSETD
jgi:hypothetical protein